MSDELDRLRREVHAVLQPPGVRPDDSLKITRRTFMHKSLLFGAATVGQRHRLELTVRAVQLRDLAQVANLHARPLEVVDQVVGHRLAQIGASMQQRHQIAA